MLDQDTTIALLTLIAEAGATVALVGDPAQLPAIGRGGVLDIAAQTSGHTYDMTEVHRFTDPTYAAGLVDNTATVTGADGLPIGAGDLIQTRRNDTSLGVANLQTWTVAHVQDEQVWARPTGASRATAASLVRPPADDVNQHAHLSYAATAYGVQGVTASASHTVLSETTSAAGVYVGMTRGRQANWQRAETTPEVTAAAHVAQTAQDGLRSLLRQHQAERDIFPRRMYGPQAARRASRAPDEQADHYRILTERAAAKLARLEALPVAEAAAHIKTVQSAAEQAKSRSQGPPEPYRPSKLGSGHNIRL